MALIRSEQAQRIAHEAVVLDLGDLRREAERIRERARAEAMEIVEAARERSRRLTEGAEERGRAEGFARGHAEGMEAGRAAGREEAMRSHERTLSTLESAWVRAAEKWDAERRGMVLEARRSLLELAVKMAEKIVRRVPAVDPGVVADQVSEAIEHVARPRDATIRIHPEDRPIVEQALPRLVGGVDHAEHVALADDPSIARGGCVVSCGQGRIDATLDKQLNRLIEAFLPGSPPALDSDAGSEADLGSEPTSASHTGTESVSAPGPEAEAKRHEPDR